MLTTSLGTMLGGTINSLCRGFLPNNLNEGNMEYVYFLIAILSAANLVVYAFVSRGFKYQSAVCASRSAGRVVSACLVLFSSGELRACVTSPDCRWRRAPPIWLRPTTMRSARPRAALRLSLPAN
jgi:hypothetical protein